MMSPECDSISHHWHLDCLFNKLFKLTAKKHQSSAFLALCEGNLLVTSGFHSQRACDQAGKLKFFGTRPNWVVSFIAYTKFHSPRPVFQSPGQIFTCIGQWVSTTFLAWWCRKHFIVPMLPCPALILWCPCFTLIPICTVLMRLLYSPSLVAVGLSVGFETWLSVDWHQLFVIGCLHLIWDCLSHNGFGAHMTNGNFHNC